MALEHSNKDLEKLTKKQLIQNIKDIKTLFETNLHKHTAELRALRRQPLELQKLKNSNAWLKSSISSALQAVEVVRVIRYGIADSENIKEAQTVSPDYLEDIRFLEYLEEILSTTELDREEVIMELAEDGWKRHQEKG